MSVALPPGLLSGGKLTIFHTKCRVSGSKYRKATGNRRSSLLAGVGDTAHLTKAGRVFLDEVILPDEVIVGDVGSGYLAMTVTRVSWVDSRTLLTSRCSGLNAGFFGGVALGALIFYASGIPRIQQDIFLVRDRPGCIKAQCRHR